MRIQDQERSTVMVESETTPPAGGTQYALAGWLAIASAVLLVPEVVGAALIKLYYSDLLIFLMPLRIINLLITVYILYMLKRLLNKRCQYFAADITIYALMIAAILFFGLGILEQLGTSLELGGIIERSWMIMASIMFVLYSIVNIILGVTLLKVKTNLFGLLRPYAYLVLASGVFGATVLLAPVGLIAAVGGLVVMGMMFLRAKDEGEFL